MPTDDENDVKLTERKFEVLRLIAAEKADKEIAFSLGICERTVRYHLANINTKLETISRVGAVAQAVRLNLIP